MLALVVLMAVLLVVLVPYLFFMMPTGFRTALLDMPSGGQVKSTHPPALKPAHSSRRHSRRQHVGAKPVKHRSK